MKNNQRVRISTPTIAILAVDGERKTVTVPVDEIVTIQNQRDGDRLVDVLWNQQHCQMFSQDLTERGVEV